MSAQPQVALVTGASGGIGREIALQLARLGATVVGSATGAGGVTDIDLMFREEGLAGRGVVLDVGDPASCEAALNEVESREGPVTILVNPDLGKSETDLGLSGLTGITYTFANEVVAWETRRNQRAASTNWRFTTQDARIKLKHLYPSFDA